MRRIINGSASTSFGAVEQDPAEAAAEDHADRGEEDHVIDVGRRPARAGLRRAAAAEPPADGEADHVHQAVPADRERTDGAERADGDEDRVDRRVGNHCCAQYARKYSNAVRRPQSRTMRQKNALR